VMVGGGGVIVVVQLVARVENDAALASVDSVGRSPKDEVSRPRAIARYV
jgi:hypothetical protein